MNVKPATTHPLATQEIDGMIDMISTLIEKGYAYNVNGTVYFRTRRFEEYGKLSHKNLDDLRSGNRSLLVTGEDSIRSERRSAGFCTVETEKRRRAVLAVSVERRTSWMAYRVLRYGEKISGRRD